MSKHPEPHTIGKLLAFADIADKAGDRGRLTPGVVAERRAEANGYRLRALLLALGITGDAAGALAHVAPELAGFLAADSCAACGHRRDDHRKAKTPACNATYLAARLDSSESTQQCVCTGFVEPSATPEPTQPKLIGLLAHDHCDNCGHARECHAAQVGKPTTCIPIDYRSGRKAPPCDCPGFVSAARESEQPEQPEGEQRCADCRHPQDSHAAEEPHGCTVDIWTPNRGVENTGYTPCNCKAFVA